MPVKRVTKQNEKNNEGEMTIVTLTTLFHLFCKRCIYFRDNIKSIIDPRRYRMPLKVTSIYNKMEKNEGERNDNSILTISTFVHVFCKNHSFILFI